MYFNFQVTIHYSMFVRYKITISRLITGPYYALYSSLQSCNSFEYILTNCSPRILFNVSFHFRPIFVTDDRFGTSKEKTQIRIKKKRRRRKSDKKTQPLKISFTSFFLVIPFEKSFCLQCPTVRMKFFSVFPTTTFVTSILSCNFGKKFIFLSFCQDVIANHITHFCSY